MITLQERVHHASKPADWQLDKLHQVLRVRKGHKNDGMKEDNLLSLSYGRIITKDINTSDGLLPENFEGYQIVENGNIVLRLTDLQNDKRSLRQGMVTQRGIITSAYDAVEVCRDNDPRFWFYVLLALDIAKHYYSLGGGVRQSIKFSDFPNDWVYRPDLPTQRAIADFLDRETARIDLLIEKKQRLVELLGEKRSAVITSAVTGDARSRDRLSVEGGGGVSDNWRWIKLSHAYPRIGSGMTPPDEMGNYLEDGGGTNWVTTSELRESLISKTKTQVSGDALNRYTTLRVYRPGSVLFAMYGATIGRIGVLDEHACCNQACCVFEHSKEVSNRYLVYWLQHRRNDLIALSVGGGQPNLSQQDLRNHKLYCPDLPTQRAIADFLDRETARIDHIRDKTRVSIDRLREYRSSLITAAITGQVDVTKWVKAGTAERRLDAVHEKVSS